MGECLFDYCKNFDQEVLDDCVDEIKDLCARFNQLNETEKGQLIGSIIGKYGVEIFVGGGLCKIFKGASALRHLKNANRLCNLEALTLSSVQKEAVITSSLKHAAHRKAYFKKITIHWDRQNKHIPGKHNYEMGKGIITVKEAELEALIKAHAGTGERVIGELGEAGFVERVDFGKVIGEYASKRKGQTTEYLPTSKGIIKYAKDGKVHVIPSEPNAFME